VLFNAMLYKCKLLLAMVYDYMSYFVITFCVCWRYHNQIARSYGILSSLPSSCSPMLLPPAMKPWAQSVGGVTAQQVRAKTRVYYKPNVYKRLKKHGLKTRLSSINGIKILWRRYLKGRTSLSTWEHEWIVTNTVRQYISGHCVRIVRTTER